MISKVSRSGFPGFRGAGDFEREKRSPQGISAVDDEGGTGHVAGGVAGEVNGEGSEVFGLAKFAHGYGL